MEAARLQRSWARPSTARLWQRALLAAGRYDELELERPEEVLLLPVPGERLKADLRAAERGWPDGPAPPVHRAIARLLNRAVILSALGNRRRRP